MGTENEEAPLLPKERAPLLDAKHRGCCGLVSPLVVRLVTSAAALGEGFDIGIFADVMVRVRTEWSISAVDIGVLTASMAVTIMVGACLNTSFADRFGRVAGLTVAFAILAASSLAMAASQGFWSLLVGRSLNGLGVGIGYCTAQIYVAEVAPAAMRGFWGAMEGLLFNIGLLLGFLAGWELNGVSVSGVADWRLMLAAGAVLPLLSLASVAVGIIPESPRYLLLRGHPEEAAVVLDHLVGPEEARDTLAKWSEPDEAAGFSDLLAPATRRTALTGVGVWVMAMLSGVKAVDALAAPLISSTFQGVDVVREAFEVQLSIGVAKVATNVLTVLWLVDHLGRRPLLLTSAGAMAVASVATGLTFEQNAGIGAVRVALIVFSVAFECGLGPVPYVYAPEVFPTHLRAAGVGAALFCSRLVVTVIVFAFLPLVEAVGAGPVFYTFGCFNFLSFVAMAAYFPETMGTRLEDMKSLFAPPS